jgi:hypothetical protein
VASGVEAIPTGVIKFNFLGTAALHRWLNLGLSVSLLSGIPFNITTGREDNRDGLANDRPPGIPRNMGGGPDFVGVDLRLVPRGPTEAIGEGEQPVGDFFAGCLRCPELCELPELSGRAEFAPVRETGWRVAGAATTARIPVPVLTMAAPCRSLGPITLSSRP